MGRDNRNAGATGADSHCRLGPPYRPRFSLVWPAAEAEQGAEQPCPPDALVPEVVIEHYVDSPSLLRQPSDRRDKLLQLLFLVLVIEPLGGCGESLLLPCLGIASVQAED